ncbi:hypothetical protein [Rathayibacter sp. VKM Ac-2630]|uniref:hypothetical protein n=1 Tax=Rathayibacter sp. VKM Ac-2630 TaxID=1938617 RepID=UPI00098186DA|nr:hypothetical protein [Rathayibacter sp. VKM Ac-2630]OOB90735.1 hypothetical protein B0T42_10025 [Rathayibacter sp. VKM Ac-2630]
MRIELRSNLTEAAVLASAGAQVLYVAGTHREAAEDFHAALRLNLSACATRVIRANGRETIRYPGGGALRFSWPATADQIARGRVLDAVSLPWPLLPLLEDLAPALATVIDAKVLVRRTA